MTNFFDSFDDDSKVKESEDVVGGGYQPLSSDIYLFEIMSAYLGQSDKGAKFVALELKHNQNTYKETIYISSSKEKQQKNTFKDPRTGDIKFLPGYALINNLTFLITKGKTFQQLKDSIEPKAVKVYDYSQAKEVVKQVPMLMPLIGGKAYFAVKEVLDNKYSMGKPTAETKSKNELVTVFFGANKKTVAEIKAKAPKPVHYDAWLKKWKGTVHDKRKIKQDTSSENTEDSLNLDDL